MSNFFYCKNRFIKLFFVFVLFLGIGARPLKADAIETLGLYQLGVDILGSPDRFFQGYQYEAENLNPSFFKKHLPPSWVSLTENLYDNVLPYTFFKRMSISFTPSTLLLSVMNYHIKGHILEEGPYLPQMTLGFGHQFYVPLYSKAISDPSIGKVLSDIDYMSFSGDFIISKSVRYNIKLYGGYRFAYGWLNWTLADYINQIFRGGSNLVNLKNQYTWQLHDLVFGVTFLLPDSTWETTTYMGFDPSRISVFLKLEFANRFFAVGLGYYPNNFLKLRPYFRFFYDFI